MNSKMEPSAVTALQNMSEPIKQDLHHFYTNGLSIIQALAEQIAMDPTKAEFCQARAQTIVKTVHEMGAQQHEMLRKPTSVNTLSAKWNVYAQSSSADLQRAFYSGAKAILSIMASLVDASEDEAIKRLNGLKEEFESFVRSSRG